MKTLNASDCFTVFPASFAAVIPVINNDVETTVINWYSTYLLKEQPAELVSNMKVVQKHFIGNITKGIIICDCVVTIDPNECVTQQLITAVFRQHNNANILIDILEIPCTEAYFASYMNKINMDRIIEITTDKIKTSVTGTQFPRDPELDILSQTMMYVNTIKTPHDNYFCRKINDEFAILYQRKNNDVEVIKICKFVDDKFQISRFNTPIKYEYFLLSIFTNEDILNTKNNTNTENTELHETTKCFTIFPAKYTYVFPVLNYDAKLTVEQWCLKNITENRYPIISDVSNIKVNTNYCLPPKDFSDIDVGVVTANYVIQEFNGISRVQNFIIALFQMQGNKIILDVLLKPYTETDFCLYIEKLKSPIKNELAKTEVSVFEASRRAGVSIETSIASFIDSNLNLRIPYHNRLINKQHGILYRENNGQVEIFANFTFDENKIFINSFHTAIKYEEYLLSIFNFLPNNTKTHTVNLDLFTKLQTAAVLLKNGSEQQKIESLRFINEFSNGKYNQCIDNQQMVDKYQEITKLSWFSQDHAHIQTKELWKQCWQEATKAAQFKKD